MNFNYKKNLHHGLDGFKQLLLPATCVLCGSKGNHTFDLCQTCQASLPYLEHACYRCALPLAANGQSQRLMCGNCLSKTAIINRTIAPFLYEEPIARLIKGLKFGHRFAYGRVLSALLLNKITISYQNEPLPMLLLPVPLHARRLRQRGYNQALELAKPLAKKLKIAINTSICLRRKNTAEQARLPFEQRKQNIHQAFALATPKAKVPPHIAIIDDVVTSGNTVLEFAKILKQAGAQKVDVWCVAKTINRSK